jgi:ketosteroid isomerase-like protein
VGYLDVHTRRRVAAALIVVLAVLGVMAAADLGPFSDPPTEADRARSAIEDFFAAARAKDYDRVCALLAPAQRRSIEAAASELADGKLENGCAAGIAAGGGGALARSTLRIRDVRVSGSLAAVDADIRIEGVRGPQSRTFKLEEIDGSWVISDLGI